MSEEETNKIKEEKIGKDTFKISIESFVIVKIATTEGEPSFTIKQESIYEKHNIERMYGYVVSEIMPRYKK